MRRYQIGALALAMLFFTLVPGHPQPTPYGPRLNPADGATVVNPEIDCNANPVADIGNAAGIVIDDANVTVINPEIRECDQGIRVAKKNGVMPTNVRIIASAAYPGYTETNFTLNRSAISWQAGNGEIGDVSAPAAQVGGEMLFVDNYRSFNGTNTTALRMHHTTSTCLIPCPTYSNADSPGAHWGLKFIADRTRGEPYEASHARFDHNFVQGFDDEGISFDPRGNAPNMGQTYAAGRVTARAPRKDAVSLQGIPRTENTVGMYVTLNEGARQGRTLEILSRSGDTFTVADPANYLANVTVRTRVSVGGRYFDNLIDHNTVDLFHHTAAKSGFNTAGQTFSRIEGNFLFDTPSFDYTSAFHLRTDHQCIMLRSAAGPRVPAFSFNNSIIGNTCQDAGDISAVVVSWGTYEVNSPTWISDNTFTGSPRGRVHRYKVRPKAARPPTP